MNLLIKKVKRVGHGFRNFANYRLRLLLHCGVRWQTHRKTARPLSTLGGVEPPIGYRPPFNLGEQQDR
jgi:hypothetical protein